MAGYTIPFALPRQPRTPRYRPRRDFVVTAGDDVTLELTIYQDDMGGGPVDVTGAEATWTIWQEGSTALVEVTGDIEDAPAGRIDVVIAAAATTDIPGRYSHTLRIEFPNGMTTVVTGMIHIQPVYGTGTGGGDPGTMTRAEGIYGDVIIGELTAASAIISGALDVHGLVTLHNDATNALTVAGGAVFGPSDFRQVEILPTTTADGPTGMPQAFLVRRVGSDDTVGAAGNLWVSQSSWVLTDTTAPAGVRYNALVSTSAGAGVDPGEVWGFTSILSTQASTDSLNAVPIYGQGVRRGLPSSGVGVPIFGGVLEARSLTGASSATDGRMRSLELDIFANGADDISPAPGREALTFVLDKNDAGGAAPHVTSVIGVYTSTGATCSWVLRPNLTWTEAFLDARGGIQGGSAHTIWMKSGQTIALDASAATKIGSNGSTITLTGAATVTGALNSSTSTTSKILNIASGAHDLAGQYSTSTAPFSLSMTLPRPSIAPLGKRNIVQWAATNDVVAPGDLANQAGSLNFFEVTQRSGFRLPKNTNSTTAAGNATLNFASTTGVTAGMFIDDPSGGIPAGSTVVSTTATTVVSSAVAVGAGVISGATITFRGLVANSWSGSRTIARFTWTEDNHPVEHLSGPEFGKVHPSINVTWSTIQSKYNRGGDLPAYGHARGGNFLDYGMIHHISGSTNLASTRLYEGSLFFQRNTSVRAALGWTVHTPTTDGTAPTAVHNAYTTRKSNNANLSWRGVFLLGDEGFAGIDAMRGTLLGYRSSHSDPKPKAFIGVDLADVNFSGRAMRWIGGDIAGGAHADAGAGRLRLGNGFLTPTATGLQIDAVGYRGSPAGTIFSLGGSLVNGNPGVEIRPNSVGDDAYGGTYHFYSPDYANNRFNRVVVLNPPVTNGAAPSNPIEVKLRAPSGAITEFPVTDIATTTAHPTELTATSATAYNGLYLAYYTGACAGEKQLISGFDPATRILTTAAFSQVPTTAVNLITNYNFASVLPTIENSILNGWQYTLNGNMSLVTNGTTSVGNATLNFASTTGIAVGMVIADASGGIPPGSTVLSMTSTTVVSSAVAVGAGVASGAAIAFQGAGGTGTVVRNLDGFTTAQLTGDGTNAASLDQSITWPANSEGVLRIFAAGPYRVKLGTTRGSSDIHVEDIQRDEPPEGEDYPRISEDIQFYSAGTTLWLRIETEQTIPVRISNVRCADVASGSAILMGVRAGVEAVPLTVNHTWTQRNTLELQPGAGPATFGGTLGVTGNFAVATNKFTIASATGNTVAAGSVTGTAFIPSSTVIPSNGMYLPAGNTLGWAINSAAELKLDGNALFPSTHDGLALGTTANGFSDILLAFGARINYDNSDVLWTHNTNSLAFEGGRLLLGSTTDDASTTVQVNGTLKATGATTLAALSATSAAITGASSVNASGTSLGTIAGMALGIASTDGLNSGLLLEAKAVYPRLLFRRANNTSASPTALAAADVIGAIESRGHDGSAYTLSRATMEAVAAEAWTGSAQGAYWQWRTCAVGGTTSSVRLTLGDTGNLTLATGYLLRVSSNTGTATGTTRTDALQLSGDFKRLSTVASGTGVILPTGVIGMAITIVNSGANPVKVYANGSETIDGTAGSTGVTLTNGNRCLYWFSAANTWHSMMFNGVSA